MRKFVFSLVILFGVITTARSQTNIATYYENPTGFTERLKVSFAAGLAITFSAHEVRLFVSGTSIPFFETRTRDIVDARLKNLTKAAVILVLLSDGTFGRIDLKFENGEFKRSEFSVKLPTLFGVRFRHIQGDDLYITSSQGVLVSRDGGHTWTEDNEGLAFPGDIEAMSIDALQNVWLTSSDGLYMQPLTSNVWTKVVSASNIVAQNVYVDQSDRIWVASFAGLHYSTDHGSTFLKGPKGYEGVPVSIGSDHKGNIYFVTATSFNFTEGDKVFRSTGGTEPFVRIDQDLAPLLKKTGNRPYSGISGDTTVWLGTVVGAFSSLDDGQSWQYRPQIESDETVSFLSLATGAALVSTPAGVFKRVGGGTWNKIYPTDGFESGIRLFQDKSSSVIWMITSKLGQNQAGSPYYSVFRSSDQGNSWALDTTGGSEIGMTELLAGADGTLYAVGQVYQAGTGNLGRVWKKVQGGGWNLDMDGLPNDLNSSWSLHAIGKDDDGAIYVNVKNISSQEVTVYRRDPTTASWIAETTHNGIVFGVAGVGGVNALATDQGVKVKNGTTYKSLPIPDGVNFNSLTYTSVAVGPKGRIWAWFEMFDPNWSGGMGAGVYYTDENATWKKAVSNLDTIAVADLIPSGDSLFVITSNAGIMVIPAMSAASVGKNLVQRHHTVPNPTRGVCTIELGDQATGLTNIRIFSLEGTAVKALDGMPVRGGVVQFDLGGLPAGSYYYSIEPSGEASGVQYRGKVVRSE